MNSDSPDRTPGTGDSDVEEREVARLVRRYIDPNETVSDDELRTRLQEYVHGTVVDIEYDGVDLVVTVERTSDEDGSRVRDAYSVSEAPNLDGEPTLEWTYLGPGD